MNPSISARLSALCLAAGRGTRLAPLTERLPKPLCPAGDDRLLGLAVGRAAAHARRVAVNAHHLAEQVEGFLAERHPDVHLEVERSLLGTGGAIGNVRQWLGDDDLMVINTDSVLVADTDRFVSGWDRTRLRMLVVADATRPDFQGTWRYAGVTLIPNSLAVRIPAHPSNLSDELFRPEWLARRVDLVPTAGFFMDCGTPFDLLVANLTLSGGATVVSDGAVLAGTATSSLIMPGAVVDPDENLEWAIRLDDGRTVELADRFAG